MIDRAVSDGSKARGLDLVEVPFYADRIAAIRGADGKNYAVIRRICENIGVNFQGQIRNLQTTHADWSGVVIMSTPDERGRPQELAVIPIDKIPMWLVQIKPSKVAPEIRERLRLYRAEAAEVLARHFLGAQPTESQIATKRWADRIRDIIAPHMQFITVNHPGCFSVISALSTQLLLLEDELLRNALRTSDADRPDVSIGLCWAAHRRSLGMAPSERFAPLRLPDQNRDVLVAVYSFDEYGLCASWFGSTYLPDKFYPYLDRKPAFKVLGPIPPARTANNVSLSLAGREARLPAKARRILIESRQPKLLALE